MKNENLKDMLATKGPQAKTSGGKNRSSNFELLRILSIIGIVLMHASNLQDQRTVTPFNSGVILFIHTIFNACVTIFVLISGYFSIRFDSRRFLRLHHTVILFALATALMFYFWGHNDSGGILSILSSFVPVMAYKYWFISCYFVLYVFSPWFNKLVEHLSKREFELLLCVLLAVFSLMPTFLVYEMQLIGGKNILNMVVVYLIGRYIRLYWTGSYDRVKLLWFSATLLVFNYFLNVATNHFFGLVEYVRPFSRDLATNNILLAVAIFMLFREFRFENKIINYFASGVLSIYMFEEVVRGVVRNLLVDPDKYLTMPAYAVILLFYVAACVSVCLMADILKRLIFDPLDARFVEWECRQIDSLKTKLACFANQKRMALSTWFTDRP